MSDKKLKVYFKAILVGSISALIVHTFAQRVDPVIVAELVDGGKYSGEMQDHKIHGEGEITWPNGDRLKGQFLHGIANGKGQLTQSDGTIYNGEFKDGEMHGQGKIKFGNGDWYKGTFKNNEMTGQGNWHTADFDYRGSLKNGKFHGQGEAHFASGDRYIGQFNKHKFEGTGVYTTADGESYSGEFKDNQFTGQGTHQNTDKTMTYVGSFLNWQYHGTGTLTQINGDQYSGEFQYGALSGKGTIIDASGASYEGDLVDWRYHGEGTYVSADGDQYHGGFSNGRFDGKGSYTLAKPVDGIEQYTGRWQNGELIDASEESLIYNQKHANEALLYIQSNLLETALNQIKANNPELQELYFIGIGGDGRQEVFRREVEYVESLFKQNLTTEGHSVSLINSKRTYDRIPMATNTSVKRTLDKFAATMDRENDILFLYLTSHGSRDHDFFLNQPGMPLPDLSATMLAQHLQSLSIQHKVVVISACYSGGFIPFLDDGKTLVITAAREDRTSFGCDDRNDFTFFGEAYFKEGIAKGLNFTEAFEIAKQQIEQWETEEGLEASHPQIKAPDQLAMRLNKWFAEQTSPDRLVEAR